MNSLTQPASDGVAPEALRIGQLLQKARLQKGFEIAWVAKELHLQLRQVHALESGDFSGFTNPIFVKGYLRACARLLSLDGDELVRLYESIAPQPRMAGPVSPVLATRVVRTTRPARKAWWYAALFVVTMVAGVTFVDRQSANFLIATVRSFPSLDGAVDLSLQKQQDTIMEAVIADRVHEADAGVASGPAALTPVPSVPAELLQATPAAVPVVPPGLEPSPSLVSTGDVALPAQQDTSLHLEFSDDCWVQIKTADGKIVHERLQKTGDVVDIPAESPLHVWFGKAAAVNMSYNGTAVTVPVKPGHQSARFVLGDESVAGEVE